MPFSCGAFGNGIPGLMALIPTGPAYYVGLALLTILVIVLLVHAYRVWEEIHDVEESDSPSDLLESFEQAHAAGELDDQELERVRRLLHDGEPNGEGSSVAPGCALPRAESIEDPSAIRRGSARDASKEEGT